ncbi:flagellar hook-length control protein FliK [Desulfatitalea alkaliphila]|uniref:Flagellar hook-length control protein FliK n=1 Tax=Desulfatitalea alkaliphila TaxID=2929485 RepID=A0AA41R3E5_9BACT|nr:flagellar hook-length control protein FliK [Desulfatitalea alkaliphila]MCJ8501307.1 flagellar hook-length control protein FliK [Desulfatitalea alkaliphila]
MQLSDDADGPPAAEGERLAENQDFRTTQQRGQDRAAVTAAMVRGAAVQEGAPDFKAAHAAKMAGPGTEGAERVPGEKEPADKALQAKAAAEKVAAEAARAGELSVADKMAHGRSTGTVGERDEKLAAAFRQAAPQALGVDERDGGRPGSGGDEDRTGRGRDAATRGGILFQKGEGKSAVPEPFGPMTGQDTAQSRSASATTGPSNEAPGGSEPRPVSTELGHTAKADNGPEPQPLPRNVQSDVMRQIVQRMTLHTEGRQAMMQIQLKPEVLGQLRMQIVTEHQQVTIRIAAENTQVKQLIEQNMHVLRNELQQQGLQIQKVDVVVPQDPQQDPWQNPQDTAFRHQRQRQGQHGRSRQATGRDNSQPAAAVGGVGESLARSGRNVGANGEVDFFA